MSSDFRDRIEIRDTNIMGQSFWHWVRGDEGAFGNATDGPMRDWIQGHSIKYFQHVKNYNTIVTGGGCCGMYSRFYALLFKRVIVFEPDPISFHCLVNNTPYENVTKINAAMGSNNGTTFLKRNSSSNIGTHTISPSGDIPVIVLSIDSLNLDSCSLIQLDTEGFERECIQGALNTINKYKPVIVAEKFDDFDYMRQIGYKHIDKSFMDNIFIPEEW